MLTAGRSAVRIWRDDRTSRGPIRSCSGRQPDDRPWSRGDTPDSRRSTARSAYVDGALNGALSAERRGSDAIPVGAR